MASYFFPDFFCSDLSSVESNHKSISGVPTSRECPSSTGSQQLSDSSNERLRGPTYSPAHLFQQSVGQAEAPEDDDAMGSLVVGNSQKTLKEHRKMPGSGINEFDTSSESVRAIHSPIDMDKLFGPEVRTYARARPRPRRPPQLYRHGKFRVARDPRYPMLAGPLSPYASSSSSSDSPPPYEGLQPILQSSIVSMRTPPHQKGTTRKNRVPPASITAAPENYLTSPTSPPSLFSSLSLPSQRHSYLEPTRRTHRMHSTMSNVSTFPRRALLFGGSPLNKGVPESSSASASHQPSSQLP